MLSSCLSRETLGRSARGFLFSWDWNGTPYSAAKAWGRKLALDRFPG
jgi:hypothetical protein